MDEAINDALAEAGHFIVEAVRIVLVSKGLPDALRTSVTDGRFVIASDVSEVDQAERGELSAPPTAPIETAARAATIEMLDLLQRRLQEALR